MMDIGGDNPVTLIVKAPNQRIADQTVDCFLEWTVRKLKEHLENVYPSKPKHNQQKLIYSGKLLQDHVTLKEVLRQFDEASLHTVHLVCVNGTDGVLLESSSSNDSCDSVPVSPASSSHSITTDASGGLRYRGHPMPGMDQFQFGGNAMSMPPMAAPPGYGYSPEQYLWMQQMYTQYMTQYMQYYNNAYQTPPNNPEAVAATEGRQANQNQVNNAAAQAAPAANPNMRMNAQGGMEEDDEDDLEHRDWLDYIYILFRFLVLMSVVYFYSTFSRFVAVFTGFFLIYLLQKGWLNLRRNPARQQQQQPAEATPAQQQQQQQQQQHDQQQNQPEQERQEGEGDTPAVNENLETPAGSDAPAEEEQRPGVLTMVWCFLSTFFTSLVPQQPPAVNAN